jgi:hypothetical protein
MCHKAARGKTAVERQNFSAIMNPVGCTFNFHPWSGRRLSPEETKFFTKEASLVAAGDAGEVLEDSNDLAADASRRATSAKIEAIKNQATSK